MEETGDRPADAAKARTRLERLPTKPQRHRPPGRHPLGSCRPRAPRAGRPQMQGPHEAHAGRTSHPRNKLPPRVPARREPCRAVLCARDNRREPGALTQMGGLPRPPTSGQAVLAWRAGTALRGKAEERGPPPHCQPACGGPRGTRLLKPFSQTEICACAWARTLQGPPGPPAPCNGWGPWHPAAERGPGQRAEPELHAARIPRGSLTGAHAGPWPTGRAALLGVGGPGRTVTADGPGYRDAGRGTTGRGGRAAPAGGPETRGVPASPRAHVPAAVGGVVAQAAQQRAVDLRDGGSAHDLVRGAARTHADRLADPGIDSADGSRPGPSGPRTRASARFLTDAHRTLSLSGVPPCHPETRAE